MAKGILLFLNDIIAFSHAISTHLFTSDSIYYPLTNQTTFDVEGTSTPPQKQITLLCFGKGQVHPFPKHKFFNVFGKNQTTFFKKLKKVSKKGKLKDEKI
jgi:hypothetical protein